MTMNKNKTISILLILVLVFMLSACGRQAVEVKTSDGEQDLSGFVSRTNWTPIFPIYKNSIVWEQVPKDYTGVLDSWVTPKQRVEEPVNIRENPSLSANIIGELRSDDNSVWWCRKEFYVDDGSLFVGIYKVKNDDLTWTPVELGRSSTNFQQRGWIALELVDLMDG